jgi:hypothetical protein
LSPATDGATEGSRNGPVPTDSSIYTGFVDSLDFVDGMNFMDWSEDTFNHALEELNWELPANNSRLDVRPYRFLLTWMAF